MTRATPATSGWWRTTTRASPCFNARSPRNAYAEHFGDLVRGTVTRYELPNIRALNFVLTGALDGGGTMSLRSDHLGKVMYAWLLRMEIPR